MSGLLPGSSLKQSDKTTRLKSPIKLHFPISGVSGIHVAPVSFVSAQAGNIKNQKIQGLQETAGPVQLSSGRPHRLLRPSWGPAMRTSGENFLQLELEIVGKNAVRTCCSVCSPSLFRNSGPEYEHAHSCRPPSLRWAGTWEFIKS